ncbi:MAG: acyl-ACP thioesterase domain-containing protein [Acidimicrobiales bacterium]
MREHGADRLVEVPATGRVFRGQRRVRFGDVSPGGRARFDALARFLQDISNDDTVDSGLDDDLAWVVRRTVFEVRRPAVFRELLELATFCSGIGSRWAERRIALRGDRGAVIDAATLWVHVELPSGRPVPLSKQFLDLYGPTAAGREVTARLRHPSQVPEAAARRPWQLRFSDFDPLGHVNNAVSWAMIEDVLASCAGLRAPYRAELEYRDPIERDASITLAWTVDAHAGLVLWALDEHAARLHLTARVAPLPV